MLKKWGARGGSRTAYRVWMGNGQGRRSMSHTYHMCNPKMSPNVGMIVAKVIHEFASTNELIAVVCLSEVSVIVRNVSPMHVCLRHSVTQN
jgi:hypothetical protein